MTKATQTLAWFVLIAGLPFTAMILGIIQAVTGVQL